MKKRMRVLSMLVCLALLMSTVPVDLPFASALATEADAVPEAVAADAPAPEPEEVPEEPPAVAEAPAPEPTEVPVEEPVETEATEVPAAPEATAESDAPAVSEPAEQPEVPDAPQSPEETEIPAETEAPEPTEDPNAIDYAADASQSKAFRNGLAEVIHDDTLVFEGAGAQDEPRAKIGRGVVYVSDRTGENDSPDRVKIAFNAGPEVGVDGGWVDASAVRPMEPTQEIPAYMSFCAERDDLQLLFYQDLAELPLARIACVYRASEETAAPEVTQAPAATEEPAEEPTPVATEHPIFMPEEPVDDVIEGEDGDEDEEKIVDEDADSETEDEAGDETDMPEAQDELLEGDETGMPEAQDELLEGVEDVEASIDQDELEMYVGRAQQLNLTLPEGTVPMLTSSNIRVATVSQDGVVKAIAPGEAEIKLIAGDEIDTCQVTSETAPTITLQADSLTLAVGESYDLQAKGFVTCSGEDSKLSFTSLNTNIATVTEDGVLKGVAKGTATIRVMETKSTINKDIQVNVQTAATGVTIRDQLTLSLGMQANLNLAFSPADSYYSYTIWSENPSIAGVTQDGVVTAMGVGTTTILVETDNGLSDSCALTVEAVPARIELEQTIITLVEGETGVRINATAYDGSLPEGAPIACDFIYEVASPQIVTVKDGELITVGPGETTVTVKAAHAEDVTAECTVKVLRKAQGITLRRSSIALGVGDTFQISDEDYDGTLYDGIIDADGDDTGVLSYSYRSTRTKYATVSNTGLITAKKAGYSDIVITPSDGAKAVTLRVNVSNAAGSVSFNRSELVIGAGGTAELSVVFPSKTAADYMISSNDEEGLITFERNGTSNTWTLKAAEVFNEPTVTLTVTSLLRGYEDTCAVTIMPGPRKIELTANKPLVDGKYVIGVGEPGGKVTASFAADEENKVGGFEYAGTSALAAGKTDGALTANTAATSTTVTARATVPYESGMYATATADFEVRLAPNTITLKSGSISMGVGDTYSLTDDPDGILVLEPAGSQTNYTFAASAKSNKSKKTSVLTVDANTGLITAKKAGTAYVKITPKSENDRSAKTLTVKVSKATGTIALNAGVKRLGVGMKDSLTVSFSSKCYGRFNVSVEDSVPAGGDEPVIKVTQSGQTIQLEALHPGKATVKVETEARKYVDTCCVTVVEAPTDEELLAGLTVPAEIGVGEAGQAVALSYPGDKLAKVTFKSTMPNILDVNATTGALTAKSAGNAAIYVVVNDVEHQGVLKTVKVIDAPTSIVVEPASLTLEVGRTYQIDTSKIALTPETARVSYNYKSSKTKYATVSGTGLITAKKVGSSTITVSSKQNSKVYDTISVKVVKAGTTFVVNPAAVTLGVGMSYKMSAAKAPAGTLSYESSSDAVTVDADTGEIKAAHAGTALITAKVTTGEGEAQTTTVSAAATVTVLPAPAADQITFSADSVERVSANQRSVYVKASCAAGTMAEIGYRIQGTTPAGITLSDSTGAMTAGPEVPGSGSFTIEAYDKNNPTVCASREVKMVPAATLIGLTASTISLGVGESFRIIDDIKLEPADGFASFSFTSYKTYKKGKLKTKNSKYASVNATTGVVTGKKAGTNYIQISCHNGGTQVLTVKVYNAPGTATLSPATLELGVGMTGQLKSNYASGNRYESSNDLIAAVDEATGLVTAKGVGYATITVTTWNNKTDTSLIHVVNAPTSVHMEPEELTVGMGQKNVKVVATPGEEGTLATFSYASDRQDIVTVDPNTGVLTPVAPGENVSITATAQGNSDVTGTTKVTVKAAPSGLKLNTGSITLGIGDTYQINDGARETLDILPSDADPSSVQASYSYYASTKSNKNKKTSVATVSGTGLITGKKKGTAYVRISDQAGHTQPMRVTVYKRATSAALSKPSLTLSEGMETTLTVNFPKSTWVDFDVENSNPAAVDTKVAGQTITVTGLKAGEEATITLRTVNGLVDTCHVFVTPAPTAVNLQLVPGTGSYLANSQGNEITIGVGESNARIIASTDESYIPCNFEYSSNDTGIVTVGSTGVLSARAAGKDATITVKVKYGDAYIQEKGQVTPPSATVTVHTVAGPAKGQLTLAQGTVTLGVGDTYQIEEYHLDENGQGVGVIVLPEGISASYTYKSSKTKYATVSGTGLVTAKKAGTTKIRITAQNNKKVYTDLTIKVMNYTSSMSILPAVTLGASMTGSVGTKFSSNAYGLVKYESSNPEFVTVNPSTGALTAAGPDAIDKVEHATITATLERADKTSITDTCYVTVLPEPQAIAIDYDEIKGVETDDRGEKFVRIGVNEAGVKVFAYCVTPDTMCDYAFSAEPAGLSVDAAGTLKATTAIEDYYTVTVTAKNNESAKAQVKVKVVAAPTGVSFATGTLSLGVGDTYQLKETTDGGIIKLAPETVTSASFSFAASSKSNKIKSTSVLAVSGAGLITAKKTGTAYVKVTTQNGKYSVLTVKVYNKPASISLNPETLSIGELSTGKVSVVYPANTHSEIASFVSSDPSLLSVDLSGNITVGKLTDGKAKDVTITATTQSGVSGKATITVLPHPTTLNFAQESYELSAGMTLATAVRLPEGTMAQHFKYESQNPDVVTIDASGILTGTNAGGEDRTATITVTANPDDEAYAVTSAPVTVTVHPAPDHITYEGAGLPAGKLVIAKGDVVTIPQPLAYTADNHPVPASYTFTTKNARCVSVSGDKMTAVAAGTTTITAAAYNSSSEKPITASFDVTVSANLPTKLELYDGDVLLAANGKSGVLAMYVNAQHPTDTVALTAKVTGADVNCGSVSYESSAPTVVEVSASGVLTALKEGSATITATTGLGGLEAKFDVTVGKLCDTVMLDTAKSLELSMGQTKQIEFTFSPSNTGMRMRYASSAADVASVDPDGKITAVGGGKTTITITGQNGWSEQIEVKVLHNPDRISLPVRKLYMKAPEKVEPVPEEGEPTYNYDSVDLAPVLAKTGVADLKDVNLTTNATSDGISVVEVTQKTPMDQAQGKAATYTLTAKGAGSAQVTISTHDSNVKFVLEIVVGEEKPESGFGWNPLEGQELVIMKGDTAPLALTLTSELFKKGEGVEGGFTVEVDPPEKLAVKDGIITANELGSVTLSLKSGESVLGTQKIEVIEPVAPKLYYGVGENPSDPIADGSAIELDVIGYTVNNAKHLIRIDPIPGWKGETGYMLLGTFAVEISSSILSYIAENQMIATTSSEGQAKVTVTTGGGKISVDVTVFDKPVYRALLISEFNGSGQKNDLPFAQTNINWMKETLGQSVIDGQKYIITEVPKNSDKATIQKAFSETFKGAKKNDVSLIYFMSHGHNVGSRFNFSLSVGKTVYSTKNKDTFITDVELMNWVQNSEANNGNVILVLNGCHTGGFIKYQDSALKAAKNIAVLTTQYYNKRASYYVGNYLGVSTFEFLVRAFCAALGNTKKVGSDPWGNQNRDASGGDKQYTIQEVFPATKTMTQEMVNKYCYKKSQYCTTNAYGFKCSASTAKQYETWYAGGNSQVPQIYIPAEMQNLVFFGRK